MTAIQEFDRQREEFTSPNLSRVDSHTAILEQEGPGLATEEEIESSNKMSGEMLEAFRLGEKVAS